MATVQRSASAPATAIENRWHALPGHEAAQRLDVDVAAVIGAQAGLLQRILETRALDFDQWLICIGAALTIVVASEIRKLLLRRNHPDQAMA